MATSTLKVDDFPPISERKTVLPLENNPDIMTPLAHALGLSTSLSFHDIYSFSPSDNDHIPKPIHALLLIQPMSPTWHSQRTSEENRSQPYAGSGATEPVFWIKQTINNACGLIGLIHCLANLPSVLSNYSSQSDFPKTANPDDKEEQRFIVPGSVFDKFLKETVSLGPVERAAILANSEEFEKLHMQFANRGDSKVPPIEEGHSGRHYVALVRGTDGRLWELEGARKGPVERGELVAMASEPERIGLLSEEVMGRHIKPWLSRELGAASRDGGQGLLNFSCLALAGGGV